MVLSVFGGDFNEEVLGLVDQGADIGFEAPNLLTIDALRILLLLMAAHSVHFNGENGIRELGDVLVFDGLLQHADFGGVGGGDFLEWGSGDFGGGSLGLDSGFGRWL